MAIKAHFLFSNFSSGEISPKIEGRTDLAQYFNGVQELKNWLCVPQGGVKTRGGFHFVHETKMGESRLIPFSFSELQNYMLLFGEEYIWFFMNSGIIITQHHQRVTKQQERKAIQWPNSSFPIDQFRVTTTNVIFNKVSWASQGAIQGFGGSRLVAQTLPSSVPYEILTPYWVEDNLWLIRYAQDDESLYLVHPLYPPMVLTRGVSHTDFSIEEMDFIDGPYEDEINSPTITPTGSVTVVGSTITLTASAELFQEGHVGALWRIKQGTAWGYVKISAYTSKTIVSAVVKSALTNENSSDGHREGAWSDVNGYPKSICFHEGKLLFAGNYEHPQTIWASKTGKYTDFTPGVLDNDAYSFTPSDLNVIRWIAPMTVLCIGALNAEATAVGPNDGPITAVDPPRIKAETTHGSSDLIAPVRVGGAILFLQKAARKIREFVFSYTEDKYRAPDLTLASEHLFTSDIIDLVYQQEPDSILWGIKADGSALACTYDRYLDPTKGGIVGWSKHDTDGYFWSTATIPYQNVDQLWAIFIREIGGVDRYYVEYYDPDICVDSGLTYSGVPVSTLSGLEHLAGKTVQIVGDGALYNPQVIPASGEITLEYPTASNIYVGLGYTPKLVTNRPEVQMASGTSQGLKKRWSKIIARVLNTTGIKINGQVMEAREPADLMGVAPPTYSGDVSAENLGWDTDGRITIEQPLPLPAHVVALFGTLNIGED